MINQKMISMLVSLRRPAADFSVRGLIAATSRERIQRKHGAKVAPTTYQPDRVPPRPRRLVYHCAAVSTLIVCASEFWVRGRIAGVSWRCGRQRKESRDADLGRRDRLGSSGRPGA